MAVSLRIVIGGITAFVVLVVAVVTLSITLTVSINAVRNTGERLADAMVNAVSLNVQQYMQITETHLFTWQNMTKINSFTLPSDEPGFPNNRWHERWMGSVRAQLMEVNYSYSSISVIFDDGPMMASLNHQYARGWAAEAYQYFTTNASGFQTFYLTQTMFNIKTKAPWNTATQGFMPIALAPRDTRTGAYALTALRFGNAEICFNNPPGIDHFEEGRPRFILYSTCVLFNQSRVKMGQASIGRFLDEVNTFLMQTAKTPNTEMFVVDIQGLIVASTNLQIAPQFGTPDKLALGPGCASSALYSPGFPVRIGCRSFAINASYKPLAHAATSIPGFITTTGRILHFTELDGNNFYAVSQRIPSALSATYFMNLLFFMPESDVLGDIVQGRNIAIGVTVAVFVVAATFSVVLIGILLAPLDDVARRMYLTAQLSSDTDSEGRNFDEDESKGSSSFANIAELPPTEQNLSAMTEIKALQVAYTTMDSAIKSFTRYVPRDVVKELMVTNQMCEIQMRPMRCSMLFTDIANFTSICERVAAPVLSSLVKLYFERASRIVMGHGGIIDKFIGDCIMAVWGAPVPIDHSEVRSAVCAKLLSHEVTQDPLKKEFNAAGEVLNIRVGVATGEVLAGNMGSQARMNYTVIGDEVNLAARLEALNKQWGTGVMIAESTAEECASYLVLRYIISIAVVGKKEPVRVYEVIGVDPNANTEILGAITSDASEQQTSAQVQRNKDQEEMAAKYGTGKVAKDTHASAGKLLRRLKRKCPVTPEEITFAKMYSDAIGKWNSGDFASTISALRNLQANKEVPTGSFELLSVQRVLEAAEQKLKALPEPGWTGVWIAESK